VGVNYRRWHGICNNGKKSLAPSNRAIYYFVGRKRLRGAYMKRAVMIILVSLLCGISVTPVCHGAEIVVNNGANEFVETRISGLDVAGRSVDDEILTWPERSDTWGRPGVKISTIKVYYCLIGGMCTMGKKQIGVVYSPNPSAFETVVTIDISPSLDVSYR
jgi:hypothetical protein